MSSDRAQTSQPGAELLDRLQLRGPGCHLDVVLRVAQHHRGLVRQLLEELEIGGFPLEPAGCAIIASAPRISPSETSGATATVLIPSRRSACRNSMKRGIVRDIGCPHALAAVPSPWQRPAGRRRARPTPPNSGREIEGCLSVELACRQTREYASVVGLEQLRQPLQQMGQHRGRSSCEPRSLLMAMTSSARRQPCAASSMRPRMAAAVDQLGRHCAQQPFFVRRSASRSCRPAGGRACRRCPWRQADPPGTRRRRGELSLRTAGEFERPVRRRGCRSAGGRRCIVASSCWTYQRCCGVAADLAQDCRDVTDQRVGSRPKPRQAAPPRRGRRSRAAGWRPWHPACRAHRAAVGTSGPRRMPVVDFRLRQEPVDVRLPIAPISAPVDAQARQ